MKPHSFFSNFSRPRRHLTQVGEPSHATTDSTGHLAKSRCLELAQHSHHIQGTQGFDEGHTKESRPKKMGWQGQSGNSRAR
jgi:hypothetical protein